MSSISNPNEPKSHLYTCLTCQVAFHTADRQRTHYHSDWHRYNLKRKVADLPPVTSDAFASKVLAQKYQLEEMEANKAVSLYCHPCKKDFSNENTYKNHVQSKKHKDNETKYNLKAAEEAENNTEEKDKQKMNNKLERAQVEAEIENDQDLDEEQKLIKLVDEKIKRAIRLTEVDCLFCTHKASDFDSNMEHMTEVHSFFIPDIEYLIDLKGLIKYLGEKISIANVCLYCNGKGRELKSLEAVRMHMASKGHAKIAYDLDMDIMEISDFYDFSSSYGELPEGVDPDAELSARPTIGGVELADNELELILPNGTRLGHRSLARYYKQHLRPVDEQEARSMQRLLENSTNGSRKDPIYEARGRRLALTHKGEDKLASKQAFKDKRLHEHYRTRVGINANRLQRHFREQIL